MKLSIGNRATSKNKNKVKTRTLCKTKTQRVHPPIQEASPPAELVAIRTVSHGRDRKDLVSRIPEPSTIV